LTDATGTVTLARSFEPYGSTLSSAGSGETIYQYTGEVRDAATNLTYLRARFYASATGTFLTADPSRQERNLFQYAGSNPVNRTDPSGLFSREIVAKSFGYSSFDEVLAAYESDYGGILTGKKWGWVATLLAAEDGDVLRVGSPVISDLHPYVHYKSAERIWLRGCDEIMIGSRTLLDYTNYVVDTPNPRELPIIWRDTSASYYVLVKNRAPGIVQYVDGDSGTDLPDFHSVDISIPIPEPILRPLIWICGIGFNASFVADRFGATYVVVGGGFGCGAGVTYSEGYIVPSVLGYNYTDRPLPDPVELQNTITGLCAGAGVSAGYGIAVSGCQSKGGALIFSIGTSLNAGVDGSWGFLRLGGPDPLLSWNSIVQDQLNGVTLNQLRTISETP